MSMSGSVDPEAVRQAQRRQQDCFNAAIFSGCKASATALVVSGGLSAALLKYSDLFRSHFTVGSKAAFIMLPVFYSFWWASETSVARCSQDGSKQRFRQALGINAPGATQPAGAVAAAAAGDQ